MSEVIVSVIIPCFNHGHYLMEAIQSVERCQKPVYEIIIVNDGSTDEMTNQLMRKLALEGYCVIEQTNQGLAAARNAGIQAAHGRYILPLDADNKIRPDYIVGGIEILDQHPEVGVVYGNGYFFGEKRGPWIQPDFDLTLLILSNQIDACALIRKKVWEDCGGYDCNIPMKLGWEDWELWLNAVSKGWKFYHVKKILFDYRVRSDAMNLKCALPENSRILLAYLYGKYCQLIWRELDSYHTKKNQMFTTHVRSFFKELRNRLTESGRWFYKWDRPA